LVPDDTLSSGTCKFPAYPLAHEPANTEAQKGDEKLNRRNQR
jgi:hypothetical protein